jgi:hypothetical protein
MRTNPCYEALRSSKLTLKLLQASALSFLPLPYPTDPPDVLQLVFTRPPGERPYTRSSHTMGLPKAIQEEARDERTCRNRTSGWCPDRRGNLECPCRLGHRQAHHRSRPPRAEVRNALGTRDSTRGGGLPHRGWPSPRRLVASLSGGKEDGNRAPRPQGSKAPLRGDSSGMWRRGQTSWCSTTAVAALLKESVYPLATSSRWILLRP